MKTQSHQKINIPNVALIDIKEDLIGTKNHHKSDNWLSRLLQKELQNCAQYLAIEPEELRAWIEQHGVIAIKTKIALLRMSQQHQLDPLKGEILLLPSQNESWQVHISIDGWIRMIHRHPAFAGLSFAISSELENGLPIWMECTIYRADQTQPITVREYLAEVKRESEIWQQMPRRMLRHKTLLQCAKIGLGLSIGESSLSRESSNKAFQANIQAEAQGNTGSVDTAQPSMGVKNRDKCPEKMDISKKGACSQSERLKILLEE